MGWKATPGTPGRRQHWPQRRLEGRPYTNCTGMAFGMALVRGGLRIVDRRDFIAKGRAATGVPEVEFGRSQGTKAQDWIEVFGRWFPWIEIRSGWFTEQQLKSFLEDDGNAMVVGVRYPYLPTTQRRWSPSFQGSHRCVVDRYFPGNDTCNWRDPLPDDPQWDGEPLAWDDLIRAMKADGYVRQIPGGRLVWCVLIEKGASMSTLIETTKVYTPAAEVRVPAGSQVYTLDRARVRLVRQKDTAAAVKAKALSVLKVSPHPTAPPSGDFLSLLGGGLTGKLVRKSAVTVVEHPAPNPPPDDWEAQLAAALQLAEKRGEANDAATKVLEAAP